MVDQLAETRRTYDLIAQMYAVRTAQISDVLTDNIAALAERFPAGGLVADIGCGPGRDTGLLRAEGFRAIGLDLSLGQLQAGGLTGMAIADMRALPLRTRGVDAVWCMAALLHIPHAIVPTVLAEFARVVRPGGALFLGVAEGDGEGWEVARNYESDLRRWFAFHRESSLTALLTAAGFTVDSSYRNHWGRDWLGLRATRHG